MPTGLPQESFSYGEITPQLYGRIGFDGYYKGLRTCRNFIVSKYGGVDNRPGTQFIDYVYDSAVKSRLIPFQFNNQQQYVLVLGDKTMQIVANGALITNETPYPVTGLTATLLPNPAPHSYHIQLTITAHPFSTNDIVFIAGVSSTINGAQKIIKINANTIQLYDPSPFKTWTGGGTVQAGASAGLTVVTPWSAADLPMLKFTQSTDVITVTHSNYRTYQIQRLSQISWIIVPFANVNGPFLDINIDETIIVYSDGVTGTINLYSSKDLFTASMIGCPFYMQQAPDETTDVWEVAKSINIGDIVIFGPNYYIAETAGTSGTVGPTVTLGTQRDGDPGVTWRYLHSGFGIVTIATVANSKHATAVVNMRLPDPIVALSLSPTTKAISDVYEAFGYTDPITGGITYTLPVKVTTSSAHGLVNGQQITIAGVGGITGANGTFAITLFDDHSFYLNGNWSLGTYTAGTGTVTISNGGTPTYLWAKAAWSPDQGYPGTTTYFQNRQLFGGTNGRPSTINMSRSDGFYDFGVDNPILDDNAITYKLLSNKVNIIRHLLELKYLIVFTSGGIYRCTGGKNGTNVVTPSTIDINSEASVAISDVAPVKVRNFALFLQDKGSQVNTLGYSFSEDAFVGKDITVMSNHLLKFNTITDWFYQEIPNSCLWSIRNDGALLGLTFFPEQQITAWHRHDTQGVFESGCCITENNKDVIYFIVYRTINSEIVRCIERMSPRDFDDQADAFFVDCGLTYDGRVTNTKASTFTGLDHLEGETVSICGDGIVFPQQVVTNGTVIISTPVLVCHIGLPYTSDLETLDISSLQKNIRDKKKIVNGVSLIVERSAGFEIGPDVDNLVPFKPRSTENYDTADSLISQLIDKNIPCEWNKTGRILVRQENPLPCSILAIIPQIEASNW